MAKEKTAKKFNFKLFGFILWLLIVGGCYYIMLPPINPSNIGFWAFFIPALFVPLFILAQGKAIADVAKGGKVTALWPVYLVIISIVVFFIGDLIFSPIFNAKVYTTRITITESSFENDIKEVDFNNLPLLDKTSSQKVGDRVVGQIPDLVSQFSVSEEYTLINYNGEIVRVSPLEYNGFFKYLENLGGTAGYVLVDTTTGETSMVRLENGLKYLPSAYFSKNLRRHVRFAYPFDNFGEASFELDDQGNPYWVIQTIKYTWVGLKPQVSGIILVNVVDGTMQKYAVNEVPTWIDNVYDASLVISEIDSWGSYQSGYLNSMFAQKNVVQTTDGYTYMTKNDDVYMYTGITSVTADESNIGFVMVNLRTHQADYYEVPGAEEYSAMDSATGAVQEKNYTSTFPLLINLNGKPTYLLSLKDAGGLVKMYAFVDVQDYQKVSVTDSSLGIQKAANNYLALFGEAPIDTNEYHTASITIADIKEVVVNGNTYYVVIDNEGNKYSILASINLTVTPFIQIEDQYTVTYYLENNLRTVTEIK